MNPAAVKHIEPALLFAFLAWAAACAVAWRSPGALLPARLRLLLAAAGGCLAASCVADWLANVAAPEDRPFVYGVELGLLTAGWLALGEFGRRRLAVSARNKQSAWWLLLLPALAALSGTLGVQAVVEQPSVDHYLSGLAAAFYYLLGVPTALLAAAAFAEASRPAASKARRGAIAAAIAMLVYGLANLFLPPPAAFFPADWLNQEVFFFATGVPAAWVSGLCGSALASGLWIARPNQQTVYATPRRKMLNQFALPAGLTVLAAISLALGGAQERAAFGEATAYLVEPAGHSGEDAESSLEVPPSPMQGAGSGGSQEDSLGVGEPSEPARQPAAEGPKSSQMVNPLTDEGKLPQPLAAASGDRLKMGLPLLIILFLLTGMLCGLGAWASRPQQPSKQLRRRTRSAGNDGGDGIVDRRARAVVPQSPIE